MEDKFTQTGVSQELEFVKYGRYLSRRFINVWNLCNLKPAHFRVNEGHV